MHQIEQRMKRKEQVILLHNRRGHASFVQCVQCGTLYECPQCAVSLTYHSYQKELHCHYCGFHMPEPRQCKNCNSFLFVYGAAGTQQIEKQLKLLFPSARILRMDSDTTTKKDSYDVMYQRMKEGTVDILLGTQMIAKGLDFSGVTLVGVISADIGLNFPDFRAAERTYQLLTQVAGRSGRGEKPGEVIIQTYNPEHYAIRLAVRQDYASFAIEEMSLRKGLFYPPFSRIGRMIFSHKQEQYLQRELKKFDIQTDYLRRVYAPEELTLLGPTPTPLTKLQNMFRYHLIIKAENASILSAVMNHLQKEVSLPSGIKVAIDIDPLSLM
jgi:primosomal protein N' (replication factor Y)